MLKRHRENDTVITTAQLPRWSSGNGLFPEPATTRPGHAWPHASGRSPGSSADPADMSLGSRLLWQIGVVELLDRDERPTFVLDLHESSTSSSTASSRVIFTNESLRAQPTLLDAVTASAPSTLHPTEVDFRKWVIGRSEDRPTPRSASHHDYGGFHWTRLDLRGRFRVISGAANACAEHCRLHASSPANGRYVGPIKARKACQPDGELEHSQEKRRSTGPSVESGTSVIPLAQVPRSSVGLTADLADGEVSLPYHGQSDESGQSWHQVPSTTGPAQPHEPATRSDRMPADADMSINGTTSNHVALTLEYADGLQPPNLPRTPSPPALAPHVQLVRSVNWAATSLGPVERWPYDLRIMSNFVMTCPFPAAMYWGPDLVTMYNEAYIPLAGRKHPELMGKTYLEGWAEVWDAVKDCFERAFEDGQAIMKDEDLIYMQRNGYLEETYFSWAIIPLVGEDGTVVGLYNPAFEKTSRKIAERRMRTLRELGEFIATARDIKGFWARILKGLEGNAYDAPFVLLYSVLDAPDSDADAPGHLGSKYCELQGSLGVPPDHPVAPSRLDFQTSKAGFAPYFRQAQDAEHPILLEVERGTLSPDLMSDLERRGFGDDCTAAVVCPIHPTSGDSILGFLVMGLNPRRPYDDDYELFVHLLSRQLATSIASVVLFEEEIKRGQQAARRAALDRNILSELLAARTQEALESETKFARMAEMAPVGMFITTATGDLTYLNDRWFEMSGQVRSVDWQDHWPEAIQDEDRERVLQDWSDIITKKVPGSSQFRFKAPWEGVNGIKGENWALMAAFPEKDADGTVKGIFGCITNISEQKWAEHYQKQRMEEALEMKRQQENFIDMTSHEMRNPLSAILQCADEITASLPDIYDSEAESVGLSPEAVEGIADAAQTIVLCAQHQKRIVDDVLTLSKLDSALLLVTPVSARPETVVQRALKMFEGELKSSNITLKFEVRDSYKKLGIDWVKLDPSRLLQVLINLITNAIKFTQPQRTRTIVLSLGASLERPSQTAESTLTYFTRRSNQRDLTTGPDWGTGEEVFLNFAVQDTGRGLKEDEKKLLFLRFSQASPKTHVQYGGSGLGLFISRELTELQGGEIGVESEYGKGSTFAFYIKCKRASAPSPSLERSSMSSFLNNKPSKREGKGSAAGANLSRPGMLSRTHTRQSDLKVLIVEDNLVNQQVLQRQLSRHGCAVFLANHGVEALEKLQETTFWRGRESLGSQLSVILMDLEMPIMDGLTCARRIRELEEDGSIVRHVPIIAVTANARMEHINKALGVGMDIVVSKPFRIEELIPRMEELVAKYAV